MKFFSHLKHTVLFLLLTGTLSLASAQTKQVDTPAALVNGKGKSLRIEPPPIYIDREVVNETALQASPSSNAKMAVGLPFIVCNPTTPKSPAAGTSGFIANACLTMSGAGSGSQMTAAQPNHIAYFDNLGAGQTYTFVASANGSSSKTKKFTVPTAQVAGACMSARYNSTGGVTYVFGFATGVPKAPATLCV